MVALPFKLCLYGVTMGVAIGVFIEGNTPGTIQVGSISISGVAITPGTVMTPGTNDLGVEGTTVGVLEITVVQSEIEADNFNSVTTLVKLVTQTIKLVRPLLFISSV